MSFSDKLTALQKEVSVFINSKVALSKVESKHRSDNCLKITNHNKKLYLSEYRYLSEIIEGNLIDNEGYEYQFSALDFDILCELADSLK